MLENTDSQSRLFACATSIYLRNVNVPLLRFVSGSTPKHISESTVGHLSLSVSLRVTSAAVIERGVESLSKSPPEVAKELHILVRSDSIGHTV